MTGMPDLHHAGTETRSTWIGHTLVVREPSPDVRRAYLYEDAIPEPRQPRPPRPTTPRLSLRRAFRPAAG